MIYDSVNLYEVTYKIWRDALSSLNRAYSLHTATIPPRTTEGACRRPGAIRDARHAAGGRMRGAIGVIVGVVTAWHTVVAGRWQHDARNSSPCWLTCWCGLPSACPSLFFLVLFLLLRYFLLLSSSSFSSFIKF